MRRRITDRDWQGIRAAARRCDWKDVERRAIDLDWPIVAHHARRAPFEPDSIRVLVFALILEQPDAPDPFSHEAR